ncbi:MAG: trypsin-like peptidase domain-containing protein [Candidatus Eisenbacteria bacterium]|nr:trypsin-like peptidase domain-containing protein [Candidatus Eisenbacteria bacterium]
MRGLGAGAASALVIALSGATGCGADSRAPGGSGSGQGGSGAAISSSRRTAIVTAAERVSPAVVSVSVVTTRLVRTDPFGGMFRDEFFQRFYPQTETRERVPGMGSGVIVDGAGLVVTNEHVVHEAEKITVTLSDGRQVPGTLLGASTTYDLAVLRIKADRLPVAPFGDSDHLLVGEWAIAIGNPFGFLLNDAQPTVTAGVISATRRDIKSEITENGVYKNMIQTDAAINPGNSGGPLVNGDGEVIGINTFIFTQGGGGSLGIGFAIPINLARRVIDEITEYGRVRAAWPGMQIQELTPALAQRLGYSEAGGLVVARVEPSGPADRVGVKVGDRLLTVNGLAIHNLEDAQRGIYGAAVGDRLNLELEREARRYTVSLVLAEAPREAR